MKEGRPRLRPLGIADILDETVELYKTNFLLLIGIAAVVYVPASFLGALLPHQPEMGFGHGDDPGAYLQP